MTSQGLSLTPMAVRFRAWRSSRRLYRGMSL
jgi:hypothetical protein